MCLYPWSAASEGPGHPLSMCSFASLGTSDGRILSSSVNSLAKRSGQKSRLTQQFYVPLWFAVSKLLPTHGKGCLKWAYTCFHSSSHLSDFTHFRPFSPFCFSVPCGCRIKQIAYLGQGKGCLLTWMLAKHPGRVISCSR